MERAHLLKQQAELEEKLNAQEEKASSSADDVMLELRLVHGRLQELESDTAVARAGRVLSGLQFSEAMINGPIVSLSGLSFPFRQSSASYARAVNCRWVAHASSPGTGVVCEPGHSPAG